MRSCTHQSHVLEIRENEHWHRPVADMYRPAVLLAYQGRIVEAIEMAETIRIREYGEMHGLAFRVVTTTKTISVNAGSWDQCEFF